MIKLSLTCLFLFIAQLICVAENKVQVTLTIQPATHSFSCRYMLTAANLTSEGLVLNLDKKFSVESVTGPRVQDYKSTGFYDSFQKDTLRRLTVRFTDGKPRQTVTIQYRGVIAKRFYADSVADFTAHAAWMPTIPNREYDLVTYRLTVQVPKTYQVVSTNAPRHAVPGAYTFVGRAPNIEITAIAAQRFTKLVSASAAPKIVVQKANRAITAVDQQLLADASKIIAYQNRIMGRKDPIRNFTFLLPGLDRSASGLLDNAAVIAYTKFDSSKPEDLLVLAHEISHKWWGYGTWNDYNNWLNEGFATYSGLLYLRATGDTASFRKQLAKRQESASTAPAVLGFEPRVHDYPTFRKAMYDKPTVILYALHQRIGDAQFFRILTETAAAKIATTEAFLELVERQSSRETRLWLTEKLST